MAYRSQYGVEGQFATSIRPQRRPHACSWPLQTTSTTPCQRQDDLTAVGTPRPSFSPGCGSGCMRYYGLLGSVSFRRAAPIFFKTSTTLTCPNAVAVQGALSSFVDSLVIRSSLPRHQLYYPCFPSSAWFPFPDASNAFWLQEVTSKPSFLYFTTSMHENTLSRPRCCSRQSETTLQPNFLTSSTILSQQHAQWRTHFLIHFYWWLHGLN